ncbi:hypothetical protein [uncultured Parabacteroides sp.]|uniref:hypothetical protein n=1 Tax=uncultured Parabacteroides sp. TaxID=512312 RepID=UPI00259AEF11|nr:hypothetical protein [uncultured Parabacteroides sp.]
MPSTIPYEPSLVLGNIVKQEKLDNAELIAAYQAEADAKEVTMNSLIALRTNLDMTVQELTNLGVETPEITAEIKELNKQISTAAAEYGKVKLETEKNIQPLRATMSMMSDDIESPLDYTKSEVKSMGVSSDSMQLNVRYFSVDSNKERSESQASSIGGFVSEAMSGFGQAHAMQLSKSVQKQFGMQNANHELEGTLVISISCTHKNARIFSPLILDPDKMVAAWNKAFPDEVIDTKKSPLKLWEELEKSSCNKQVYVLSGATYGSSFVGMIHVLKSDSMNTVQNMEGVAQKLQTQFKLGGWFADLQGGFGVEDSFANSVKNLISSQNIQSHCSLATMGVIPSIKSNQVKMGVKQFADSDPDKEMQKLATLQGATATENNTLESSASAARTGKQMISLHNATIQSTLTGLSEIDDGQNGMIDINSLMTAMDDYVQKCSSGDDNIGVPINYYLKSLDKATTLKAWLEKYYPKENISGGDQPEPEPGE